MSEFRYVGSELELFAGARNWKSYWASQIRPYLRGDVLEVGAGIGASTAQLCPRAAGRVVCLEPDAALAARLEQTLRGDAALQQHSVLCGTTQNVSDQFDTVVYIDVLEHVEDDRKELQRASALMKPGGHLIVISPAHLLFYSAFDRSIGHFRRYNKRMLREITPPGLKLERLRYLDSTGLLASLANRFVLRQSLPTRAQLRLWDRWMIPLSRIADPLSFYALGKTVLAVWSKPA